MEIMENRVQTEIVDLVNSDRVFSDIHIQEDQPVMLKAPSGWVVCDDILPFTREDLEPFMRSMDQDWTNTLMEKTINRPVDLINWRLRINAYIACGGESVCLSIRKIPRLPLPFDKLGLPSSINMMLDAPRGIILIGGATGTGKTTTIAALLERINNTRNAHVITVEDPIEYVMVRNKSIFSQREVGVDVHSYYDGVRDAMRQRPDVVVIGEIRERETAEAALIAAESGHLVIASLHANTVVGAITKMLGFFPSHERDSKADTLQSTLVGAIGQILLPSLDRSRVVLACELMFNHKHQFSNCIGNKDKLQSAFERGEDGVSRTFNQSLLDLVKNKRISDVDALASVVYNQTELYDQIKQWRTSGR